ncbi:MAG TPA: type I 3-dehydroquinate dehydratase, partial [Pyrinomonadaceae bacterium]|nr:type I 3-dehydroquinate dehydratase [Pyrinomonadaceae bacterium]
MNHKHSARICVPVCEKDLNAMRRTCEWGDFIELRLDCLEEIPNNLSESIQHLPRPAILTLRPAEQGGHRKLTLEERQRFWSTAPRGESI